MTYKEIIIADFEQEVKILKHLHTKITPELMDYRPQEGMRSLRELLTYLSYCSIQVLHFYSTTETNREKVIEKVKALMEEASTQPDFPSALDYHYKTFVDMLNSIPEEDLFNKMVKHGHFKEEVILGTALQHSAFKNLSAYRMQLFLYLKLAGQTDLNTFNNWRGFDMPVQ